jgi:inosine/xanthosine triphosphatase
MESMKTIVVASQNPVKLNAVLNGFKTMFPQDEFQARGVDTRSGVSDQPMGDEETLRGACQRAAAAMACAPEADFWAGIEGGAIEDDGDLYAFAWVVIQSRQRYSRSRTGTFLIPPQVAELVRQGLELGDADDRVFHRQNSKQADGAIGLLTGGILDRTGFYLHAVLLALTPFKSPEVYDAPAKFEPEDAPFATPHSGI